MRHRELGADVDQPATEVDVVPHKPQQLGQAHPGVQRRRDERAVRRQATVQQPRDLLASQRTLGMASGSWALVTLELLDRVIRDPAVPYREPHHVSQRPQSAGRGLLRATALTQKIKQLRHVGDRDLTDQPGADQRQHMPVEVVAVDLERPQSPLTGDDAALVALKPPARDSFQPQPRRRRDDPKPCRPHKRQSLRPRELEVVAHGAKPWPTVEHEAHDVLAVRLP